MERGSTLVKRGKRRFSMGDNSGWNDVQIEVFGNIQIKMDLKDLSGCYSRKKGMAGKMRRRWGLGLTERGWSSRQKIVFSNKPQTIEPEELRMGRSWKAIICGTSPLQETKMVS